MHLKLYLMENGIRQKDFAKQIDYGLQHLSTIVNGKQNPSRRFGKAVEQATNGQVTYEDMLAYKSKKDLELMKTKNTGT